MIPMTLSDICMMWMMHRRVFILVIGCNTAEEITDCPIE